MPGTTMTLEQWHTLKACARGQTPSEPPVALIVDSPWLPGYAGITTLDYLTIPQLWLEANLKLAREFPEIIFLPGFWVEMGMATEPSGFGCRFSFFDHQPPNIEPLFELPEQAGNLPVPDPATHGLMPVVLNVYRRVRPLVQDAGHTLKIVAARGPLALASHLMGVSNFLLGLKVNPGPTHSLLEKTTTLVRTWLQAQAEAIQDAEGILVLDDIAGFLSPKDYREFAHPYLKGVFDAFPGALKIFHNDTDNPVSYPMLSELGIHIFNFTHLQPLEKVRQLVGPGICLMGNVPPLEVLTQGTPMEVTKSARRCLDTHRDKPGLILSAGGGVSPGTPAENIRALARAPKP